MLQVDFFSGSERDHILEGYQRSGHNSSTQTKCTNYTRERNDETAKYNKKKITHLPQSTATADPPLKLSSVYIGQKEASPFCHSLNHKHKMISA